MVGVLSFEIVLDLLDNMISEGTQVARFFPAVIGQDMLFVLLDELIPCTRLYLCLNCEVLRADQLDVVQDGADLVLCIHMIDCELEKQPHHDADEGDGKADHVFRMEVIWGLRAGDLGEDDHIWHLKIISEGHEAVKIHCWVTLILAHTLVEKRLLECNCIKIVRIK